MGGHPMRLQDPLPPGNSIFYSRWDGESWTQPNDIISIPDEAIADFISVAIDSNNRLHAVWTGQEKFYYSSAPSSQAYSAHAWSKPVALAGNSARSAYMINIAADHATGALHVAYATRGEEAGVYYTRSTNGGLDWEMPVKLSVALDDLEDSFSGVRIIVDDAGRLHAVWQTNQSEGYGQAIYYAHSLDQGQTWSQPVQLGYRGPNDFDVGSPYIVARGKSELHLIYYAGAHPIGRYHRISQDGGNTWSEPYPILTDMEGINGYVVPVVDGAGQMHLIINMRTRDTQIVGIYYSSWLGTGWSPVVPLATADPYGPSAHYTAATVGLGNELHVVWTAIHPGEIWYLRGLAPGVTPAPTVIQQPQTATPTPSPTDIGHSQTVTVTPQPTALPFDSQTSPPPPTSANAPLLYGVGASVLVVASAIIALRLRARRR